MTVLAVAAATLLLCGRGDTFLSAGHQDDRHGLPFSLPGTPSEAHRRLFTPAGAPAGAYAAAVLPSPMTAARKAVMRALGLEVPAADPRAPAPPGQPWAVRRLEVAEAFGASGPYEPTRLARLFNGRRAEVCRGPVVREGRVVASVTLISPYPDPALSRLVSGTLVIVVRP